MCTIVRMCLVLFCNVGVVLCLDKLQIVCYTIGVRELNRHYITESGRMMIRLVAVLVQTDRTGQHG